MWNKQLKGMKSSSLWKINLSSLFNLKNVHFRQKYSHFILAKVILSFKTHI